MNTLFHVIQVNHDTNILFSYFKCLKTITVPPACSPAAANSAPPAGLLREEEEEEQTVPPERLARFKYDSHWDPSADQACVLNIDTIKLATSMLCM